MMPYRLFALSILLMGITRLSYCQKIENLSTQFSEGNLIITYDLISVGENVSYDVYVFTSHDNFAKPVSLTKGDAGNDISPGMHKKIEWNAVKELGNFKGDLQIELRSWKYVPFVVFENINTEFVVKRGKPYTIEWEPSSKTKEVYIELFKGEFAYGQKHLIPNNGNYTFNFDKNIIPSDEYNIAISDPSDPLKVSHSSKFKIKRKIPNALKAIPILLIGTAAILLTNQNSSNQGIPEPPTPPNFE